MSKFKHDPETDTVTMPATYWRALAVTKQVGYAQDGKIRYIEPRNVLMNSISDALLRDVVKWDQADIDELFALIEAPGSGAPMPASPAKLKADDGLTLTPEEDARGVLAGKVKR